MVNTMLQTSMGDFYFDAVFKTEHSSNMIITEHPVQTGAPISDHAYMEPEEISCEIGMSDVNGDGLSVQMYQQLRTLMQLREPFTVVTRLHTYNNMLIASMSVPDDYTTMNALKAGIIFKQVFVVEVATVQVQQTVSASKADTSTGSGGSGSGSNGGSGTESKAEKKTVLEQLIDGVKNEPKVKQNLDEFKKKLEDNLQDQKKKAVQAAWDKLVETSKKTVEGIKSKLQNPVKTTKTAIPCTETKMASIPGATTKTALTLSTNLIAGKINNLIKPTKD